MSVSVRAARLSDIACPSAAESSGAVSQGGGASDPCAGAGWGGVAGPVSLCPRGPSS